MTLQIRTLINFIRVNFNKNGQCLSSARLVPFVLCSGRARIQAVNTTPEKFENAVLFLRLGLPSTLIFIKPCSCPPGGEGAGLLKFTTLMFRKRTLNETDTRDLWNTH